MRHSETKYPAGTIATSLGNGIKDDSIIIIINIQTYQSLSTIPTMSSISSCMCFRFKNISYTILRSRKKTKKFVLSFFVL